MTENLSPSEYKSYRALLHVAKLMEVTIDKLVSILEVGSEYSFIDKEEKCDQLKKIKLIVKNSK